jgi:hypothetical protein
MGGLNQEYTADLIGEPSTLRIVEVIEFYRHKRGKGKEKEKENITVNRIRFTAPKRLFSKV